MGLPFLPEPITTRAHCVGPHFGPGIPQDLESHDIIVALHFKVRLAGDGGHLVESYLRLYSA